MQLVLIHGKMMDMGRKGKLEMDLRICAGMQARTLETVHVWEQDYVRRPGEPRQRELAGDTEVIVLLGPYPGPRTVKGGYHDPETDMVVDVMVEPRGRRDGRILRGIPVRSLDGGKP